MEPKLIYHTPQSASGGVSPFDTVITEMVAGHDIRIVSPYLSLDYLRRMIADADSWKLVSDIGEWLSTTSMASRSETVEFIAQHPEQIRHCRNVHAKVLVAGSRALIGSANFTNKGITGRVEMSVLFEECEQVEEARAWFDLLWSQTAAVKPADLSAFVAELPDDTGTSVLPALPSEHPGVRSVLSPDLGEPTNDEQRLVEALRLAPNREWAVMWLDLAKQLIEYCDLKEDDERLVTTLPQNNGILPITIGRRYVLAARQREDVSESGGTEPRDILVTTLILPRGLTRRVPQVPNYLDQWAFKPGFRGETEDNTPLLVRFAMPPGTPFPADVVTAWLEASEAECGHARRSNFRKFHEPMMYRVITDLPFRERILDEAFPSE